MFTCKATPRCEAFIDNQTPASVTVEVGTAMGTIKKDYTPQYVMARPNGPDCPPECKQATVTVTLS